jgi:hypothetical protein
MLDNDCCIYLGVEKEELELSMQQITPNLERKFPFHII